MKINATEIFRVMTKRRISIFFAQVLRHILQIAWLTKQE